MEILEDTSWESGIAIHSGIHVGKVTKIVIANEPAYRTGRSSSEAISEMICADSKHVIRAQDKGKTFIHQHNDKCRFCYT